MFDHIIPSNNVGQNLGKKKSIIIRYYIINKSYVIIKNFITITLSIVIVTIINDIIMVSLFDS